MWCQKGRPEKPARPASGCGSDFCSSPATAHPETLEKKHRATSGETQGLVWEGVGKGSAGIPFLSSLDGHLATLGPKANVSKADVRRQRFGSPVWGVDSVSSLPSDPMTQALAMSPRSG